MKLASCNAYFEKSGSTGFPKAVPISHHTAINSALVENFYPGIPESNKVVNIPIPLFHTVKKKFSIQ